MITFLRHLVAIVVLPFVVAVVLPVWIARRYGVVPVFGASAGEARFGDEYREYCRHVERLVPRLRPWQPSRS